MHLQTTKFLYTDDNHIFEGVAFLVEDLKILL